MRGYGIDCTGRIYPERYQKAYDDIVKVLKENEFTYGEARTLFSLIEERIIASAKIEL